MCQSAETYMSNTITFIVYVLCAVAALVGDSMIICCCPPSDAPWTIDGRKSIKSADTIVPEPRKISIKSANTNAPEPSKIGESDAPNTNGNVEQSEKKGSDELTNASDESTNC